MVRFASLALATLAVYTATASAQYVIVHSPPPAYPVVTYSSPAPVVYSAPVVSYSAPVYTTYSAPVYSAPVYSSYYSAYSAPVYSAPAYPAVSYSYYQPTTVYSPAVIPGTVTTRNYVGMGIFRPRGVYTQSYFTPWR